MARKRDLNDIWSYIALDDASAATRLFNLLTARFTLIRSSPRMGRARDELTPGLRSHPVGNYVIYYRETAHAISIVHVIHGARHAKGIFKP